MILLMSFSVATCEPLAYMFPVAVMDPVVVKGPVVVDPFTERVPADMDPVVVKGPVVMDPPTVIDPVLLMVIAALSELQPIAKLPAPTP